MRISIFSLIFLLGLAFGIEVKPEDTSAFNTREIYAVRISTDRQTSFNFNEPLRYLESGKDFYNTYLLDDIGNLLNSGYIQDLSVNITEEGKTGVNIYFYLKLSPEIHYIELSNVTIFKQDELRTLLVNKTNKPVIYSAITQDIQIIENYYHERGYLLAKVTNVFFIKSLNSLIYNVAEGKLNTVTFQGLEHIDPHLLLREISSKPGTVFNIRKIAQAREKIFKTGYLSFASMARVNPSPINPGEVDVIFDVQERKLNNFQVGLEQLPNTKLSLALTLKLPNFRNSGEGLYLKGQSILEPGYRDYSYYLKYTQPWPMDQPLPFSFTLFQQVNQENASDLTSAYVKRSGWESNVELSLFTYWQSILSYRNETASDVANIYTPYAKNSFNLTLLNNTVTDNNNPLNGDRIQLEVEKGNNLFGLVTYGGIDYSKYLVEYSRFIKVNDNNVFGFHFVNGYLYFNGLNQVIFEQDKFSVGGAYSLRGYPESYLSNAASIMGGNKKLQLNLEYRILLLEWLQIVLFMDAGIAGNDLDLSKLKYGRGLGLRLFTPIAPIRLDFAFGDGNQFIFHFALGQLF